MPQYRAPDGSIIPTLFIGMGGTGSRIVDRIATRAARLPHWDAQLRNLVQFVVVDTNSLDQNQLSDRVPRANRINLSAFDKVRAVQNYREAHEQQAEQWLPPSYLPRAGVTPGAGQIRMESRLGFFFNSPAIRQTLRAVVQGTLHSEFAQWRDPTKYNVYLFSTLAGGTGSGSSLSMAYLVDSVITELGRHPRVIGNLLLSSLLTRVVQPGLHPNIHANTYAALKEIEYMTKLGYEDVAKLGRKEEVFPYWHDRTRRTPTTVSRRPFFLSLVYDEPGVQNVPDFESAIADTCFLQLFSPVMGQLEGELDNYEQHMMSLSKFPGRDTGQGYTKNFGCVGAAVLVFPAEAFLAYCGLRFAAQAVRQQITFGIDRSSSENDERVRRIEQYAVDYSDKRFMALGPDERGRVINRAFVKRVQEMAAIDLEADESKSYWAKLVEHVDRGEEVEGNATLKENEERKRSPSLLDQIRQGLDDDRERLFTKIQIDAPGFTFFRESVSQYDVEVDRLERQYRAASAMVADQEDTVVSKAANGVYVDKLPLDPIKERYVVLRLLEQVESSWLPEAEGEVSRRQATHLGAPKVLEKLRTETKDQLVEAASAKRWGFFPDEEVFLSVREQASGDFKKTAFASREYLKALVRRKQVMAFWKYLQARAETYSQLSIRMDRLVKELEGEAERLRRGEGWPAPPYTLRVEALQRMDGAPGSGVRERLWDEAWTRLFVAGEKFMTTFNRDELSQLIRNELKPAVDASGRTRPKLPADIERDIRKALVDLGERKLRPAIYGDDELGTDGLSLMGALGLEAEFVVPDTGFGTAAARAEYIQRKIRSTGSVAGLLARANTSMAATADDGVTPSLRRLVVIGGRNCREKSNPELAALAEQQLDAPPRQIKIIDGGPGAYDPHLAVVHDAEIAFPLYYVGSIVDEIQRPYLELQADPRRRFILHTAYEWEKGLPDLDPRRAALAVDWALTTVARASIVDIITLEPDRGWFLHLPNNPTPSLLGANLTTALFNLERLAESPEVDRLLGEEMRRREAALGPDQVEGRRVALLAEIDEHLATLAVQRAGIGQAVSPAELSRKLMDRPAVAALRQALSIVDDSNRYARGGTRF